MKENEKASSTRWMYATIPAFVAAGPLATLIPLYILSIGGGILDVAYAATVYNAVAIPSAFIWGRIADSMKRKTLIFISYLLTTVLIVLLLYEKNVAGVILIYAAISFVNSANGTPLNLLVMDTDVKEKWSRNFSLLQTFSVLGTVIGLLLSVFVTDVAGLGLLITILAAASLISIILSLVLITEPKRITPVRDSYFHYVKNFVTFIVVEPIVLAKAPVASLKGMIDLRKIKRFGASYLMIFYAASFLFYMGTGVFNTEYPVGLKLHGLSSAEIFTIIFIASAVQAFMFNYSYRYIKDTQRNPIPKYILAVRGLGYALMASSFLILMGVMFFYANIVLDVIASGIAYAIFYTGSYTILFRALSGKPGGGRSLGLYSALSGIGTLLGSLVSGFIATALGFWSVFFSAAFLMVVSAYLFSIM